MPTCVVKCCSRSTVRDKKEQGLTFHRFPKESEWLKDWIQIIRECRRQMDWNPTKSSVVCSEHFQTSDLYTTKGGLVRVVTFAVPQKFLWKPPDEEEQNVQPSVSESLDKHVGFNEERQLAIESKSSTLLSETPLKADKGSKSLINSTDTVHSTNVSLHINATNMALSGADFEQPLSILYTPRKRRLKEIILKKSLHILQQKQKIKNLNQKVRRLKNRNISLKHIIKTLKSKNISE